MQQSLVERWWAGREGKKNNWFRARMGSSMGRTNTLAAGIIVISASVFLGPWFLNELAEATGQHVRLAPPSVLPKMSTTWWEQMWRQGQLAQDPMIPGQYKPTFDFIQSVTGIDIEKPPLPPRSTDPHARAFVPLCGSSVVMKHLVETGYEVDAVDCSETALRSAVERNEVALDPDSFSRLHLIWSDIFAPSLWNGELSGKKYDFIFERQGITSLNRHQREDYAFLLKRVLKEDGIMFIEAVFRTGRVAGNKENGPPFSLSRSELQNLFPEQEGYLVKCGDAVDAAVTKLDRESRVLKRVPKSLYVTTYPCVVAKRKMFLEPSSVAKSSSLPRVAKQ